MGKLAKFWVVFDSLETFTFTPGHVTNNGSHIRDGIDLKRTMFFVIVALLPALLFGTWNIGDQYFASTGESADLFGEDDDWRSEGYSTNCRKLWCGTWNRILFCGQTRSWD